jgi:hypothetical protein
MVGVYQRVFRASECKHSKGNKKKVKWIKDVEN